MKIVFMGTPDFAAASLEAVVQAGHTVLAAVTGEDKPVGRGNRVQLCAVKQIALAHGIEVLQPHRVRGNAELLETLRTLAPEVIIVAAYGQIIPKEILELPRYGCINVHASLLPAYRGAAPIQWAVIDGQSVSGVTIMQMDEGLDTGAMLARTEVTLAPDETGGSLFDRLSIAGGRLLTETLVQIEAGTVQPEPQPAESPTPYARMIRKTDGRIDWTAPAVQIERLIRGLNPWPSAYTELDGKLLKLWEAEVVDAAGGLAPDAVFASGDSGAVITDAEPVPDEFSETAPEAVFAPGTVRRAGQDTLLIQTGDGLLCIKELQLAGKKRMRTAEFLRGCPIAEGSVLGPGPLSPVQ